MQITFKDVIPEPLKGNFGSGFVWNQNITFTDSDKYLVKADSGKGKSTLLNIIYGIRKDYTGAVEFDGLEIQTLTSNEVCDLRADKIAYLFQDLRLFSRLTALQNIELKPGNLFTTGEIEHIAERMGVADQLHKPCSKLSLGQQQRIAIIRAISQQFNWLLLDEPFSHLDANNASIALQIIEERCAVFHAGIIATSLGDETGFHGFNMVHL